MNPKILILRALFNPTLWSSYRSFISTKEDKHLDLIYRLLDDLITRVDREISLDEFKAFVEASGAFNRDKDIEILQRILTVLESTEVKEDLLPDLLQQIKHREVAERLAVASFDFIEGKVPLETIHKIYTDFETVEEKETTQFVTTDLEELFNETVGSRGLRWRLGSLNQTLGSLRKGDFGFLFARPETGKTTFLASEVSYFAEQLTDEQGPLLWINNEEQGTKVMTRLYQAIFGVDLRTLMNNRTQYKEQFNANLKDKIKFVDDAGINKRTIEGLCRKYSPSLLVIDQIDKIKGFDGEREDLKLGSVYQWARELAKKHCPVIGVCQADGTGEGVKWLNMGHIANAKTSKQAEADFIIGIGKTNEQGRENTRFFNISKNKLQGDEDTDPSRRHGFFECIIQPEIARYRDIGT